MSLAGITVNQSVDDLQFDEMIPCPHGAKRPHATCTSSCAHMTGIGRHATIPFDVFEVLCSTVPTVDHCARTAFEHVLEIRFRYRDPAATSRSSRNATREPTCKCIEVPQGAQGHIIPDRTYTAIDVESDPAWRDRSGRRIGGDHCSDGETIADMPIRHRPCLADDPRQAGAVHDLLNTRWIGCGPKLISVGDDPRRGQHRSVTFDSACAIAHVRQMVRPGWWHLDSLEEVPQHPIVPSRSRIQVPYLVEPYG